MQFTPSASIRESSYWCIVRGYGGQFATLPVVLDHCDVIDGDETKTVTDVNIGLL